MTRQKIMISIRQDYLEDLDNLVRRGASPSRSALIERLVSNFLQDLKQKRTSNDMAVGSFINFLILTLNEDRR